MKDVLVTVIDVETTGLSCEKDVVTEVGFALWNATKNKILMTYGSMIRQDVEVSQEIEDLTGITTADVHAPYACNVDFMCERVIEASELSTYFMAHNAEFDYGMMKNLAKQNDFLLSELEKPWFDTVTDIPFPKGKKTSASLGYLCADHGFLNPFPHRAVFDAVALAKLAGMYPFEDLLKKARSPIVELIAQVNFDNREKAKSKKFYWNPERKVWFKNMCEAEVNLDDFNFPVKVNRPAPKYPRLSTAEVLNG